MSKVLNRHTVYQKKIPSPTSKDMQTYNKDEAKHDVAKCVDVNDVSLDQLDWMPCMVTCLAGSSGQSPVTACYVMRLDADGPRHPPYTQWMYWYGSLGYLRSYMAIGVGAETV